MNSLINKKKTVTRKTRWSTSTQKVKNSPSEELLHVNGFPAQYLSAFVSGKTAVWSTTILHFFKKGAFRPQPRGHSPVLGGTTGVYSVLAPSASPGVSPLTPKELSFGAEQLCVHVPDKGLQTSVCDGCKAEILLPWYSADIFLSREIWKFPLCYSMTAPQNDFKIMNSGYWELHICFSFWIWPKTS